MYNQELLRWIISPFKLLIFISYLNCFVTALVPDRSVVALLPYIFFLAYEVNKNYKLHRKIAYVHIIFLLICLSFKLINPYSNPVLYPLTGQQHTLKKEFRNVSVGQKLTTNYAGLAQYEIPEINKELNNKIEAHMLSKIAEEYFTEDSLARGHSTADPARFDFFPIPILYFPLLIIFLVTLRIYLKNENFSNDEQDKLIGYRILCFILFVISFILGGISFLGLAGGYSGGPLVSILSSAISGIWFLKNIVSPSPKRLRLLLILGVLIVGNVIGYKMGSKVWKEHNSDLCKQLRNDPFCKLSSTGFNCTSKSSLGNFVVAKGICEDLRQRH